MWSLRRRLLLWLLSGIVLVGLAASMAAYFQVREELDELFDRQLRQIALSLRDQKDFGANAPDDVPEEEEAIAIAAWEDGKEVLRWPPQAAFPARQEAGYAQITADGSAWRVFVERHANRVIEVVQPISVRHQLAAAAALKIVAPVVLMTFALTILVWWIVGRTLLPFTRLASELEARRPADLEPLPTQALPREIVPSVAALNGLLARFRQAMEAHQNFVADAAHELRTPLTVLSLQLDLLRTSTSEAERVRAGHLVRAAVDRLTHLAQQLLAMARLEAPMPAIALSPVDLTELTKAMIGELWPIAKAKDIDLGTSRLERVQVMGNSDAIDLVIRNIIDNAIRYTPQGGQVDVSVMRTGTHGILRVVDTGKGIPVDQRERVFDRFYRSPGQAVPGSGLGLAIVRKLSMRYRFRTQLDDGPGGCGLSFSLIFDAL
jgi:two-component system, OmpR family, sensor kinase